VCSYSLHQADEINIRRHRAIDSIVSRVYEQLETYRSAKYSCPISTTSSLQCVCMLLGALTKEMDSANFIDPRPSAPFFGQSFGTICDKVFLMKSERWCHNNYDWHSCNASTAMKDIVASAKDSRLIEEVSMNRRQDVKIETWMVLAVG
jgi:hypothetical protein